MHRNDACGDAVNLGQRIPHHQHQHQQQAISHFFKTRARRLTSPFSSVISGNLRCQNGNPQSRARAPLPHPRSTSQPPRHWETTPNATMIEVRTDQWAGAPPPTESAGPQCSAVAQSRGQVFRPGIPGIPRRSVSAERMAVPKKKKKG